MDRRKLASLAAFALLVGAAPLYAPGHYYNFIGVGRQALVCIGLSLLLGYAGQISLGQAAFFGIGAYASALVGIHTGLSPWITMWGGVALSLAVALAVGVPSLKLKGHYLAMATLAFGEIVYVVFQAWVSLTGGPSGLLGRIPRWSLFGYELKPSDDLGLFYFTWGFVILGMFAALNLIDSRIGRALRAVHDGEQAAEVLGVATSAAKTRIFLLSAVYASVAGSLYAHSQGFFSPEPFNIEHSILFVVMVVVGGMRSVWGAVLGACVMGFLPELLGPLEEWRFLIYGAVLLVIVMFLPQGLVLAARDGARRVFVRREVVR